MTLMLTIEGVCMSNIVMCDNPVDHDNKKQQHEHYRDTHKNGRGVADRHLDRVCRNE